MMPGKNKSPPGPLRRPRDVLRLSAEARRLAHGHESGESGYQTTRISMLEALLAYATAPESGLWIAPPVVTVADHVCEQQAKGAVP